MKSINFKLVAPSVFAISISNVAYEELVSAVIQTHSSQYKKRQKQADTGPNDNHARHRGPSRFVIASSSLSIVLWVRDESPAWTAFVAALLTPSPPVMASVLIEKVTRCLLPCFCFSVRYHCFLVFACSSLLICFFGRFFDRFLFFPCRCFFRGLKGLRTSQDIDGGDSECDQD